MAVFNSLGSNYTNGFVWKSWLSLGSGKDVATAQAKLKQQFGGEATLTYKGRQALELALRKSGLPAGSRVGINGFTCYVVYQAVQNAGYEPVFIDVEPGTLHFGLRQLQTHKDLKAIIVQNTLGLPADVPELEKHCQQQGIMIIEDLAHSLGAQYTDGREAGTVGDLTMLSFSQDKPLDVVAGGALIDRRVQPAAQAKLPLVSLLQRYKNRKYPFWTMLIRAGYGVGVGRYLHFGLKKMHLLATPMSDNLKGLSGMAPSTAKLLNGLLNQQTTELAHRQLIAKIYQQTLPASMQYKTAGTPSYLRFPIQVADRAGLVAELKKHQIFIGDTWYDAPIAPKRYLAQTSYQTGQCPEAEKLAATIVNLPTHKHVTTEIAQDICAKIMQWSQLKK